MPDQPSQKVAVGYVRVSTKEQAEEGWSLEEQRARIEEYASQQGWKLLDVYADPAQSGRRADRPEYQRLLNDAAAKRFDALIVWKLDRFGRDTIERLTAEAALARAGVEVVSLTDTAIGEDDAMAPLIRAMRAGMAEMESRVIGQRTRVGLRAAAASGLWHGGVTPYGYRNEGKSRERRLFVNPLQADVVQRIYSEYLAGAGDGLIARSLNHDGVPSPSGKAWDKSQVRNILTSPLYTGRVRFGTDEFGKDVTFEGKHEAIISEGDWNTARTLRAQRRAHATGGRLPVGSHLLTKGILRCGECGGSMRARTYRQRTTDRCTSA